MNILSENGDDYNASQTHQLIVPVEAAGRRLDQVLAMLLPDHSRSRLQACVKAGGVLVGGVMRDEPRFKLYGGESLLVELGEDEKAGVEQPEDIPLKIVYEDDTLLVIDKPAGLVVHPGNGNWSGTLMNALLHHAPSLAKVPRAGIVHRLDKETSGLLVVAKTLVAQTHLVRQLQARTVKRIYWAVALGEFERDGMVQAAIGRHPVQRTKMAVVAGGRPALTYYRVLECFPGCTLIECSLETGRTHQIRVHMASIKHPLLGDPVYGRDSPQLPPFGRQALHAKRLGLIHPLTGEAMSWQSPLPTDMKSLLEILRDA